MSWRKGAAGMKIQNANYRYNHGHGRLHYCQQYQSAALQRMQPIPRHLAYTAKTHPLDSPLGSSALLYPTHICRLPSCPASQFHCELSAWLVVLDVILVWLLVLASVEIGLVGFSGGEGAGGASAAENVDRIFYFSVFFLRVIGVCCRYSMSL